MGSGKGEGELLQEFSPGYSCYRNHLPSISAPPLFKEIRSPLIAGEAKWFTREWRHSAPVRPRWARDRALVPAAGRGAPSPDRESREVGRAMQTAATAVRGLLEGMAKWRSCGGERG